MPEQTITIPASSPLFQVVLLLVELLGASTLVSPSQLHAGHPDRFDPSRRED